MWLVLQLQETVRAQDRAIRHFVDAQTTIRAKELASELRFRKRLINWLDFERVRQESRWPGCSESRTASDRTRFSVRSGVRSAENWRDRRALRQGRKDGSHGYVGEA
jgi:hypothetical protein